MPVTLNSNRFNSLISLFLKTNQIDKHHSLNMSDQIKNHIINTKNHNIYETPTITLLHLTYKHILSTVHNENTTNLYYNLNQHLNRLLYESH